MLLAYILQILKSLSMENNTLLRFEISFYFYIWTFLNEYDKFGAKRRILDHNFFCFFSITIHLCLKVIGTVTARILNSSLWHYNLYLWGYLAIIGRKETKTVYLLLKLLELTIVLTFSPHKPDILCWALFFLTLEVLKVKFVRLV